MSLFRCGASSELTETTLWTNSSPSTSFSDQSVTLSESVENFKYIAFYVRTSESDNTESYVICDVDELKTYIASGTHPELCMASRVNNQQFTRMVFYVDTTHIKYDNAYELTGAPTRNSYVIPTKIVGLA